MSFSPFSVASAFLMVLAGEGGETERVLASLARTDPKVQLSVANALWANKGVTFSPDFEHRCRTFYGARASSLGFGSPAAPDAINGWVSGNTHGKITHGKITHGKITHLVSHTDIAGAVLTDAVYNATGTLRGGHPGPAVRRPPHAPGG